MSFSTQPSANSPDHFAKPVTTRIAAAVETLGYTTLVDWAMRLLSGQTTPGAASDPDIAWVEGLDAIEPYMGRVWAGQALLHAGHHNAEPVVKVAFDDEEWQVRQIAAEVSGYHRLDYVDELVELLTNDAYPYVRIAAAQA